MVLLIENCVQEPYRWMDQKVELRAGAAAARGELLEAKIYAELETLRTEKDSQIFVGRVMSETNEELTDHKLAISAHSVVLESCSGDQSSVKIFLNECPDYLLYTGQIVGVLGRSSAAGLHAQLVLPGAAIPEIVYPQDKNIVSPAPVHLTVASGPYSPENMLIFDSISDLEVRVRDNPPDKLVLMGPFLDLNHPIIASGIVQDSFGRPATFEDIYREEIIPKLARLARACENARTELIIVPSTSEARIDVPLPQPPINTLRVPIWQQLTKELPSHVKCVSNPASLQIGGLNVMITSADALSSINTNLLYKQGENQQSRVDACLEQFLKARTLFPVMPSALRVEPSLRHTLDISDDGDSFPHIIILPSLSGKRFVKKIAGRVFVNPGFMSDATGSSSSIAELVLNPGVLPDSVSGEALKL